MPEPIPLNPLIAAYAVHDGKLFGMFLSDRPAENSLKYLGRAEPNGEANADIKAWHTSSFATLEAITSDHVTEGVIEGSNNNPPPEILETPWYVIFEFNPGGAAHGDLWAGRFFEGSEGPASAGEGVFAVEAKSDVQTFGAAPFLVGELTARSVIVSERAGTGAASAEGDHGGDGTDGIRAEW
jgi:hypothetical protein